MKRLSQEDGKRITVCFHNINIYVRNSENSCQDIFRYAALLGASFFNYAVSLAGVVLLYVYFTHVRVY